MSRYDPYAFDDDGSIMDWRPCPHCSAGLYLDTQTEAEEFPCAACGGLLEWPDYDLVAVEESCPKIPAGWLMLPGMTSAQAREVAK